MIASYHLPLSVISDEPVPQGCLVHHLASWSSLTANSNLICGQFQTNLFKTELQNVNFLHKPNLLIEILSHFTPTFQYSYTTDIYLPYLWHFATLPGLLPPPFQLQCGELEGPHLGVGSSLLEVMPGPTRIQFLPGTPFRRSFTFTSVFETASMKLMRVLQMWEEAGNLMDGRYYHAVATISPHSFDDLCQFDLKDIGL